MERKLSSQKKEMMMSQEKNLLCLLTISPRLGFYVIILKLSVFLFGHIEVINNVVEPGN